MEEQDWRNWLADLNWDQLDEFIEALETLEKFDVFKREFEWTGIFKLKEFAKWERGY